MSTCSSSMGEGRGEGVTMQVEEVELAAAGEEVEAGWLLLLLPLLPLLLLLLVECGDWKY